MTKVITENLTNPGQEPVEGDMVRYGSGYGSVVAQWNEPTLRTPPPIDQGRFRLLFTFEEAATETAFRVGAEKLIAQGRPSLADPENPTAEEFEALTNYSNAVIYVTMNSDFVQAGKIRLNDPVVAAALDFFIAFGLIAPERKAQILANQSMR